MVKRSFDEDRKHKKLVLMMYNYFKEQGYTELRADLEGYKYIEQPSEVNGHIPDLTARKNDPKHTLIILEAETCSTVNDLHTESEWKAFHDGAGMVNGEFHLAVPERCFGESGTTHASKRLEALGMRAVVWIPGEERPST